MNSDANDGRPWLRQLLFGLTNWILFIAGAVNLAGGTWAAAHQQATLAATLLAAGLVLLFAATIDRFESFKGWGIEAKTRQLDQKIAEADDALRRLRELAQLSGAALIDLNCKVGRWDSVPSATAAHELAQKVRSILVTLGSDQEAIASALTPWARITCSDLGAALANPLFIAISDQIIQREARRSAIRQPISLDNTEYSRLTAEIRAGHAYKERVQGLRSFTLDEYPDRFMALFEEVPLIDESVIVLARDKAKKFEPAMSTLRNSFTILDPVAWCAEIEEHRRVRER